MQIKTWKKTQLCQKKKVKYLWNGLKKRIRLQILENFKQNKKLVMTLRSKPTNGIEET